MFSIKGDVVLDPFLGLGTTMFAAMAANRNSIGYEMDPAFEDLIKSKLSRVIDLSNTRIRERLKGHRLFIENRYADGKTIKHMNKHYQFPVMTKQETELLINELKEVKQLKEDSFEVLYSNDPQLDFVGYDANGIPLRSEQIIFQKTRGQKKTSPKNRQQGPFDYKR